MKIIKAKGYRILRVINDNVPKGLSRINKLHNLIKNVNINDSRND